MLRTALFSTLITLLLSINLNADIFVADCSASALLVFNNNASTNATPIRTIKNSELSCPSGVYVYNNEIYVSDDDGDLFVFLVTDNGSNVTPQRSTSVTDWIEGLSIYNNELYIVDGNPQGKIYVYDPVALTYKRGIDTDLTSPTGIDIVNGEIFVSNESDITIYNVTDTNSTAPKRTISSATSVINLPGGITLNGNDIFLFNDTNITIYPLNSDGYTDPTSYIGGSNTTLNGGLNDSFIFEDQLYVTNASANSITLFNQSDSGNVVPQREINSTSLDEPYDIFITPSETSDVLPAIIMYLLD
jgi:hypothetical protein